MCGNPRFSAGRDHGSSRLRIWQGEGWKVNHKKIYRLYCEEDLAVRTKKRRKRASHLRLVLPPAEAPNERWSMDFVTDRLENGRQFRILTVVDHFSRECPILEAGVSMTGQSVAQALERLSFNRPLNISPRNVQTPDGRRLTWGQQDGDWYIGIDDWEF